MDGADELFALVEKRKRELREEISNGEQARAEEEQAIYDAWVEDAQRAWDEGQPFYLPLIMAFSNRSEETPRAEQAEKALKAITAAGWRLHTWTGGGPGPMGIVTTYPLFVRGDG